MKQLLLIVTLILLSHTSAASKAPTLLQIKEPNIGSIHYIRDVIKVPMRSGQSNQHRVVHRGIESGEAVTLLEIDNEAGFAKIKTRKGLEGWLPLQYLIASPTSEIQLQQAQKIINQLKQKAGPLGDQLLNLEKENTQLKSAITQLEVQKHSVSREYDRLKSISANAVKLDEENQRLLTSNEEFRNRHDTLAAENGELQSQLKNNGFINGALVLFAGMVLTLIIQYFKQTRRRSEWG